MILNLALRKIQTLMFIQYVSYLQNNCVNLINIYNLLSLFISNNRKKNESEANR